MSGVSVYAATRYAATPPSGEKGDPRVAKKAPLGKGPRGRYQTWILWPLPGNQMTSTMNEAPSPHT